MGKCWESPIGLPRRKMQPIIRTNVAFAANACFYPWSLLATQEPTNENDAYSLIYLPFWLIVPAEATSIGLQSYQER